MATTVTASIIYGFDNASNRLDCLSPNQQMACIAFFAYDSVTGLPVSNSTPMGYTWTGTSPVPSITSGTLFPINGWYFSRNTPGVFSSPSSCSLTNAQGHTGSGSGPAVGTTASVGWTTPGGLHTSYMPSAPFDLIARPGNGVMNLTWKAAIPINPAPTPQSACYISDYYIYRSTVSTPLTIPAASGGPILTFASTGSGSILEWQDTGITNGTTYWYTVVALQNITKQLPDSGTHDPRFQTWSQSNTIQVTPRAAAVQYVGSLTRVN